MPEVITKYPESMFYVLKSAGAKCGVGEKQTILTACPREQFCKLPLGEICVYQPEDLPHMTQLSIIDVAENVNAVPTMFGFANLMLVTFVFWLGFYLGAKLLGKK